MMSQKMAGQSEDDEMWEAFKLFDVDGNGSISSSNLKQVMKMLGEDLTDDEVRVFQKET